MDRSKAKARDISRRQARQVKHAARATEPESNFVENDTVPCNVISLDSRRDRPKQKTFIVVSRDRVAA